MSKDLEEFLKSKNFSPVWVDDGLQPKAKEEFVLSRAYEPQRKDLATLVAELEEIKNVIEDAKLREWTLGSLLKFHNAGIPKE